MATKTTDAPSATDEMLIDRYLPRFDVTIMEHAVVDAGQDTTWAALLDLDLMRVHTPLLDAAMVVRGMPSTVGRMLGRRAQTPAAPPPAQLKLAGEGAGMPGWLPLGRLPGREIALGAVGRFWQPDIQWYDVTTMTPERFGAFDQPGWGRIAANFSLRPYGSHRTLVSYEARTATADRDAARRFGRYWLLVRPFVGHIMRATLATLRHDAEHRAAGGPAAA